MAESAKQELRTEGTKCILLVFKMVFAHELLKFHEYVLQERGRTVSQAHAGVVCPAPLQEMGTRRAIGGQQERGPKAPDPPITTAACRHAWGGLSHPLQQECVFGCKFLPAVKSEKTLISAPCPLPLVPPAGNDTFTRVSSMYQFPVPSLLGHMEYIVV